MEVDTQVSPIYRLALRLEQTIADEQPIDGLETFLTTSLGNYVDENGPYESVGRYQGRRRTVTDIALPLLDNRVTIIPIPTFASVHAGLARAWEQQTSDAVAKAAA